ncbi:MAG: (Fe-S)-binding protein [Bacteroidota bacterium]
MIVDIFIPCYVDQYYPNTAANMIKVLERLGCSVNYNVDQTCCGQPAYIDGYWDQCKKVGEKLIHEFQNDRYIVAPAASCVSMIKNHYAELFHNTVLHNEYKSIKNKIYEFSDFLVNVLNATDIGARLDATATYHDNCTALRELQIKDAPRLLLSKVKGLTLLEMKDTELCCGAGGGLPRKFESIAVNMGEEKIRNASDSNAQYIISTDYQCLMHMQGIISKQQKPMKVMHIADVLASGWN